MPAGIEIDDTGIYGSGKEPWHFASTKDRVDVTTEKLTRANILTLSGTDWQVVTVPLLAQLGSGETPKVDGKVATVRADTGKVLGVVSEKYQPIQNAEMVDTMLALFDASDLEFETGFSLFGNRCVVYLARLPQEVKVGGLESERLWTYLMGTTWHDGTGSAQWLPTIMRVECANMRQMALNAAGKFIGKAYHVGDTGVKLQEIRDAIGLAYSAQQSALEEAEKLVDMQTTVDEVDAFLRGLIPTPQAKTPELVLAGEQQARTKRAQIMGVLQTTPDLSAIRDTRYGALQAVSAFETHHQRYVTSGGTSKDERRFANVMGLNGVNLTTKAAATLLGTEDLTSCRTQSDEILLSAGFTPSVLDSILGG